MSAPASFLYNNIRSLFATGAFDWPTAPVNAMLVSALYNSSVDDVNVSDIPSGAIIVRDQALSGLAQIDGICSGNIPQWNSLISPSAASAIVLYSKGASDSVSPLIYYSSNGPGFPILLQGFNYFVGYDSTQGGWFQV